MIRYDTRLNVDPRWALSEGSRFFEEKSAVQEALRKITHRLNDLHIPYAVVGGMALFRHGYRRFTEDVDLLVTAQGLRDIHQHLDGLGYVPPFPNSKNLRDVDLGVKIEFLVTGAFPGDGKPKPVIFPDPLASSFDADGIRYLQLPALIELKLASGMTNQGRMRDLSDVIELIKVLDLSYAYAQKLHTYVQAKFHELWRSARHRFVKLLSREMDSAGVRSFEDLIAAFPVQAEEFKKLEREGVAFEPADGEIPARFVTSDPTLAEQYGMQDESEMWESPPPPTASE